MGLKNLGLELGIFILYHLLSFLVIFNKYEKIKGELQLNKLKYALELS